MTWIHSDRPLRDHCERQCISEVLEAAKTGPVTLEVASCARPAPLLNHRPLPPQKPSSSRRGERSPSRGRIGKAETAWAQIEAATWPVYARAQLQGVMRARCPCPGAGGRRRCRTHIYSGSPNCSSRVAAAAAFTAAVGARPPDREPTFRRACYRVGPAPSASGVGSPRPHSPPPIALCCAAPLRPSRAARRRDGCRGGDCVIVCVCIVCGATRAMRATRARGAST